VAGAAPATGGWGAARGRAVAAGAILVPTGAAALAHEAAWQRLWSPVAGGGVTTASAVVAGTLLGLAAGAAWGGRFADRARRPGLLFAAAEALGALLCLAMPPAVALARDAQAALLAAGAAGTAFDLGRVLVVALACAVPSTALGASLPALARALTSDPARAGPVLGRLYAANTAGAVLGVLLSTAFAFEALGTRGTVLLASAAQAVAAALAAALFARGALPAPPAGTPSPPPGLPRAPSARRAEVAALLAGAAALAVEIAWMRRLTPALGTTTYAFGTVLAAFLLAVAAGAALLGPRRARPPGARPAVVLALAALPVAFLAPLLGPVADGAGRSLAAAIAAGEAGPSELLRIRATAAALLLVPSALVGAAALPWLVQAAAPSPERVGEGAGRVLAANTLGSAVAAAATGLLGVPALGTAGCLRAAAGLYLVGAAVVAPRRGARAALACGAAVALVCAALPIPDAAALRAVGATFDPVWTDPSAAPVVWAREGRVATVVVRERDGRPELWVDGKIVASASPTDRLHLALLGHLPMALHDAPRRAAVVGLGTGITATAVAAWGPETLDVFEIEPEVREAAAAFRAVGGGLPPGATFHGGDGRDGLLRAGAPYDVITTDPIHPAVAGSAALYTLEHYRLIAARLAPGGLACQWMPLYELEPDDLRGVLRTFGEVFHVAAFVAGPDLVLVGGLRPFALDADAIERRLASPAGEGLEALGLRGAGRLLGLLVAAPDRLRRFADRGALNTDDRPVIEFTSARSQYTGSAPRNLAVLEVGGSRPDVLLARPPTDEARFRAGVARTRRSKSAMERWMQGRAEAYEAAEEAFAALAADDPADLLSARMREECALERAGRLLEGGAAEEAAAVARAVLARAREGAEVPEPRHRIDAADLLARAGRPEEAAEAARAALPLAPRSATARRLAAAR
jgi:spermidine synthase